MSGTRAALVECLERRILLAEATVYEFIGADAYASPPGSIYELTGNRGDHFDAEPGLNVSHPSSGYTPGHLSGSSTSFTLDNMVEHTELDLLIGAVGRLTHPMGGGPGEPDPPPEGVWKFEVWFGDFDRWWYTDGSGWGGDPWLFAHTDDSLTVTVKGTWMSGGFAPRWFLDLAVVTRWTPEVAITPVDTAVEGQLVYSPGQEPGFNVHRSGDNRLGPLVVNLAEAEGTADANSDYAQLPATATILAGAGSVFVPLSPIDGLTREWTETVLAGVEDGEYYTVSGLDEALGHIVDDDGADIEAIDVPEAEETSPGLLILVNDDDDDNNGVPDGEQSSVTPGQDDDLEQVTLRFPDEEKLGVTPNPDAQVKLELNNSLYRVWKSGGELLLGGPGGVMTVILDHVLEGPEMTVYVESLPSPSNMPTLAPPAAILALGAFDTGTRGSTSIDGLSIKGVRAALDLDIDSDNTAATNRTDEEDELEEDDSTGKVVLVTDGDFDDDGTKDTEDFGGIEGFNFTPLYLSLVQNAGVALEQITITLEYTAENLRIWRKDAALARVAGDVLESGMGYTVASLGPVDGEMTFFIEALEASPDTVPITAKVTYANAQGRDEDLEKEDEVHAAPTKLNLVLKKVLDNAASGDLPENIEMSEGAWVPYNNDDDDYSATGPGTWGEDNAQTLPGGHPAPIDGENDLLPIVVKALVGAVKTGSVHLIMPSGLGVYRSADRSDKLTATDALPADEDTTLYVEGRTLAVHELRLEYKLNDQQLKGGDEAKVSVFRWEGPLNVPEHGEYRYVAQGDLPAGAIWSGAGSGAITAMATPLDALMRWSGGPAIGKAKLKVNDDYTWGLDVNVVQVGVGAPAGAFVNPGPGETEGQDDWFVNIGSGPRTGEDAIQWKANVTMVGPPGPNGDRGLEFMKVGFAQAITVTQLTAHFEAGLSRTPAIVGNTYFDTKATTGPLYDSSPEAVFEDASPANKEDEIASEDRPEMSVPKYYGGNGASWAKLLESLDLVWAFDLRVVAMTTDNRNDADEVVVGQARAPWSWSGSGTIAVGVGGTALYTPNAAPVIALPNAWVEVTGESPFGEGDAFNTLVEPEDDIWNLN